MNQVVGEFKTKIGNLPEMPVAAARQSSKKICQPVLTMLAELN